MDRLNNEIMKTGMKLPLFTGIAILIAIFAVAGCQHNTLIDLTDPTVSIDCDSDTVYFQNDIYPLIISNCANADGCHNGIGGEEEANELTSYETIMSSDYVDPFDANNSKLIEAITEGGEEMMPPYPNEPLTTAQIEMLKTWINQGARNNACEGGDCDTINVTYSGSILNIVQTNCVGCHQGVTPSGGISLTSYSDVASIAANGSFLGSVQFEAGYVAMPYGGNMLPDCKIEQIRIWIENGYPND